MAEFAQQPIAQAAAPAEVAEEASKIHPRQMLHAAITLVLLLIFLWPGGMLVNTVEPRILGLPFYIFWVVVLLPIVNFVNLVLYARFMIAREKERQQLNLEPWE